MGIFNIFKKTKKLEPAEAERLEIEEISKWLENKQKEIENKDKEFLNEINLQKSELIDKLEQEISNLDDFDLGQRKAEVKLKLIVRENLNNYLRYSSNLVEDLKNLEKNSSTELIKKIDETFINFQKKSEISYEKATILVGDISKIRKLADDFVKQLKSLINEKKELIEKINILNLIDEKAERLKGFNVTENQLKENIKLNKTRTTNQDTKIQEIKDDIEKIKKSKDYLDEINKEQEIERDNKKLEIKIYSLKEIIDFKLLASIYHQNEKEMNTIKNYKNNFLEAYEKDKFEELKDLIDFTSKLSNKKEILEKIKEIIDLKKQINNSENKLELKNSVDISLRESEINKIQEIIKDLKEDIEKEYSLLEKTITSKKEIYTELIENFNKINVELIVPD